MVQILHTNRQFTGLSHEDPTIHIQNFLDISNNNTPNRVNRDYVRLTLFHLSIWGSKKILKSKPVNSITTWNDLAQKFLIKFFSIWVIRPKLHFKYKCKQSLSIYRTQLELRSFPQRVSLKIMF